MALIVAAACTSGPQAGPPRAVDASASVPSAPEATVATGPATTPAPASPATPSAAVLSGEMAPIDFRELALDRGIHQGTVYTERRISLAGGASAGAVASGSWTSEWVELPFAFTRLVPSWNGATPDGTWLRVEMQARRASGGETRWWSFGTWAAGDADVRRASLEGQSDGDGRVDTDTFEAASPMSAYRMRVVLERRSPAEPPPAIGLLAAVASDPSRFAPRIPSAAGAAAGRELPVPGYSQEIHAGAYPEYDGGGEAWCSPTSTAMVLAYWKTGPTPAELSWVDPRYPDPQVAHAARFTFDAAYGGTGNWPFNTAYAARYGLRGFVTQLRSLAEAERFIAAGIPLIASVKVAPGALPGFLLPQGTNGHLLVISGFTAAGDVVSHDPAATSNESVRRVYPRAAFEKAWLEGSRGTVYVIHPPTLALPERVPGAAANW